MKLRIQEDVASFIMTAVWNVRRRTDDARSSMGPGGSPALLIAPHGDGEAGRKLIF